MPPANLDRKERAIAWRLKMMSNAISARQAEAMAQRGLHYGWLTAAISSALALRAAVRAHETLCCGIPRSLLFWGVVAGTGLTAPLHART